MMTATRIEDKLYVNDVERDIFRGTMHSADKTLCSWFQDDPELAVKDIDDELFGPLPNVTTPSNLATSLQRIWACSPPQLSHQLPYTTDASLDPGFDYDLFEAYRSTPPPRLPNGALVSLPGTPDDIPLTRLPSPMIYDPEHRSYDSAGSISLQDAPFPSLNGQYGRNIAHSLMEWVQDTEDLNDSKLLATSQPASPISWLYPAAETLLATSDAGQSDTSPALSSASLPLPDAPTCDNAWKHASEEIRHSSVKSEHVAQRSSPCQPEENTPSPVKQAVLYNIVPDMTPVPARTPREVRQSECHRYNPYHKKTSSAQREDRVTSHWKVIKPVVGTENIRKASARRRKRSGNYVCLICDQDFTTRTNLQYHLNAHSGSRPYECVYCGRGFNSKSCQTRHEKLQHEKSTQVPASDSYPA